MKSWLTKADGIWQLLLTLFVFGIFSLMSSCLRPSYWDITPYRLLGALGMGLCVYGLYLSPLKQGFRICVTMSLFFLLLLVELAEFCCYWATGNEISVEVLCNVNFTNLGMGIILYPWEIVGGMFVWFAMIAAFFFVFRRKPKGAVPKATWLLLLLLGSGLTASCSSLPKLGRLYPNLCRFGKIRNFDLQFYRNCGIKLGNVTREQVVATPGKNLVFIYMESFERTYLDEKLFPGAAPNLQALRQQALNFDSISNAWNANLSFGGMYASFTGSVLTPRHLPAGLNSGINMGFGSRMASFPWILHQAGYRQMFILGPEVEFAGVNVLLEREGFDEMISCGTRGESPRHWGCYDRELFEYAFDKYRQLIAGKQPFHLMLFTIDTHAPNGFVDPESIPFEQGTGQPDLLKAIHKTDYEVSRFIRRLQETPGWENTCVILASDHLAPPNTLTDRLEKSPRRYHLNMVLNSGKTGVVTTPGKTFDIAPTVLELLQVRHNYLFPIGESLLGQPDPRRLAEHEDFKNAIDSYTMMRSDIAISDHPTIAVQTRPLLGISVDGMLLPLFVGNGIQRLPAPNECIWITISPNKKQISHQLITNGADMLASVRQKKSYDIHIVLCHKSELQKTEKTTEKTMWLLGVGQMKNWNWTSGDRPEQLSVNWNNGTSPNWFGRKKHELRQEP